MAVASSTVAATFAATAVLGAYTSHQKRKGDQARRSDQMRQDELIQQQQDAARMQQEKLGRHRRNTKARSKAVQTRSTALRNQRKTRSAMRPRSGTVLTGERNRGSILGGTGRTSIIGG